MKIPVGRSKYLTINDIVRSDDGVMMMMMITIIEKKQAGCPKLFGREHISYSHRHMCVCV